MPIPTPSPRPLEGITVIALEQAVAAPFASRQLADLGARVIKVERPGTGDFARHYDSNAHGHSSHFAWCNRSKESITLDLKSEGGPQILSRLLERADVLIQNLSPGALDRLGFSAEILHERYPRLVSCHISGYGSSGPYRDKKAYDALIQAETGFFSITGSEDTPSKAGIAIADIAAAMYAFSGILTALLERGRTGQGAVLEISLFDSLAEWMGYPIYYTMGGQAPRRTGANHATIAPYGLFASADGSTVMLSVQSEREWRSFCEKVLGNLDLADDARFRTNSDRVANRPELRREIEGVFSTLSLDLIEERLDEARIANARARTVSQLLEHPQLAARRRWTEVGSEHGPVPALLPPIGLADLDPRMDDIPTLGEHTDSVLAELDYTPVEIDRLRRDGAL